MKANEAPEKIYLEKVYPDNGVLPNGLNYSQCHDDIEYVRTDAFIEKACDAYCKVCGHYPHTVPTHICCNNCDYFSDFKKYMKGE